jgi:hypothetical protein
MSDNEVLTISQAGHLGDLVRGVDNGSSLRWYPYGADNPDVVLRVVLRAFTYEGGGMYPHDADIRDAFVWTSGFTERWLPVRDLLPALSNLDGHLGMSEPIAIIGAEEK